MDMNFSKLSKNQAYFTITQAVLPRPVAWVLSENENKKYNLAPFSFFSVVSSDPPIIMLSIGNRQDGTLKDTFSNIVERKNFVVHIAHSGQVQQVTNTAKEIPKGESEVILAGLKLVPFNNCILPRIDGARIAMDCDFFEKKEIGNSPQHILFGRVRNLFIDDCAITQDEKGRIKIAADKVDPISRLGGSEYAIFGEIINIKRN